MEGGSSRIGFIANEFEDFIQGGWGNLVSSKKVLADSEGVGIQPEPVYKDIKTLDYARLSAVLWQVCKNLDQRVKDLENAVLQ